MNSSSPNPEIGQLVSIPRSDRWQVYARLQELDIPCTCLGDGSFQATIDTPLAALQLRSVIGQVTFSRRQLVEQLERCWHY